MATTQNRNNFKIRTRVILGAVLFVALLLVTRLYFLQIVHGSEYRIEASDQYVSTSGGFYDRGSIFFVDKNNLQVRGATIKTGFLLAIKPVEIVDAEQVYSVLEPYIEIDKETFMIRATKEGDPYEEVATRLNTEAAAAIREADLDGVLLLPDHWRYYPSGALAAHTLGFVAYDGAERNGRYGLERHFDDVLVRGSSSLYINFFAELFTNIRDVVFVPVNKREGNIVTTLEPEVQVQLERVLIEMKEKWDSQFTAGIVIDPQTGAVRALAVTPTFDLNDFGSAETADFANPLIERVYEMGSIMKPLTMAAGLDSGAVTSESTYNDRGSIKLDTYTISNFDGKARGVVPMQEILSQSLNTGVAHIVTEMGKDEFRRYMYRYGINEETGIDLPNEAHNLTENLNSPRDVEYATASFGQGVALTPITMVRALSILPDGYIEQPHIVSAIQPTSGIKHELDYSDVREQILDPETAEEITRMLVEVFDEALLGGDVKKEHYSIAAKTGTAQIASPDGGYYDDKFLHSFFGYFPAFDAKYLVFLMNVEPQGAQYASQTLTEPFMEMTNFLINYYDIPPDR
ncbi:penicillin-binding protein 2 [Candidatus Kaiserbacteria bacterium]|nr:MAG: penicillin-binding protein 2 [Candidatus Kaiserbacteria bacterium]